MPPTLREIQRDTPWVWVCCEGIGCGHMAPMAIAPLLIRWGMDASSDRLRASAWCSSCGRMGAVIQRPSWSVREGEWQPFPAKRMRAS
jgi:hypothetical protein